MNAVNKIVLYTLPAVFAGQFVERLDGIYVGSSVFITVAVLLLTVRLTWRLQTGDWRLANEWIFSPFVVMGFFALAYWVTLWFPLLVIGIIASAFWVYLARNKMFEKETRI